VRTRFILVGTFSLLSVVGILLWFFSGPTGVSRQQATSDLVTFSVQTLELSAITGFAAMATLEMVKRLSHLRGWFFFLHIPGPEFLRSAQPEKSEKTEKSEKSPAVDPWAGALRCDLPLEQLMAQLGYATDQALNELFPSRNESDLSPVTATSPGNPANSDASVVLLGKLVGQAPVSRAVVENDSASLRLKTQTALDDLQVSVGNAWRWWLRLIASVLAALFALGALIYVPVPPGSKIGALVGSFLLGGFFAGLFRDLTAIAERFRGLCAEILFSASPCEMTVTVATLFPYTRWAAVNRLTATCSLFSSTASTILNRKH
jgi:hypothetical protein